MPAWSLSSGLSPQSQSHFTPLGLLQFMDLFFEFQNKRIKLGNVSGIVTLFVFSEAEQVSDVLRSPAMKVQFVFPEQQLPQRFILRV